MSVRWIEITCSCCEAKETVSAVWARDFSACPVCVDAGCDENECRRSDGGSALFTSEEAKAIATPGALHEGLCSPLCWRQHHAPLPWSAAR